ncbi:ArsR/SmtB family transcription factor [Myceligenerans pegani]|uniref:Helix-turn-helix transcriptional regulator n=1 Tax=Myceligenerans pegani TaxID=2776917 RepID=A0ABR9MZ83_9MICO|nr:metalloregulator ArsR/SmtB family transcription factor [Myceligenerans sp. TRM 65318]MBE1876692.1 helix-turn-helix transcriptional regulator [Myceligenerans sp. TRM 65318]MBE3018963.1 helix-turn-helix transcriptional regulator [Myceligenerans sp. TRM 65318]
MHAFDILGDPVRRRILELLANGEQTSGAITNVIRAEFGLSQPAVSQHLRVLRDSGFASVRPEGARRFYAVEPGPLSEVDAWLDRFRRFWEQRLDALDTELARGRRAAQTSAGKEPTAPAEPGAGADKADPSAKGA